MQLAHVLIYFFEMQSMIILSCWLRSNKVLRYIRILLDWWDRLLLSLLLCRKIAKDTVFLLSYSPYLAQYRQLLSPDIWIHSNVYYFEFFRFKRWVLEKNEHSMATKIMNDSNLCFSDVGRQSYQIRQEGTGAGGICEFRLLQALQRSWLDLRYSLLTIQQRLLVSPWSNRGTTLLT